jgi:CelD/BcsL family acetyltransferase involved in cellulose biosynthesis
MNTRTMRIHTDMTAPGFELPAIATATGPFPGREFLETWWRLRGAGELRLVEGSDALLPLQRHENTLTFLGEADLTDYHSPLGTSAAAVSALITRLAGETDSGTHLSFDSLPGSAADAVTAGLASADVEYVVTEHAIAAVLTLPRSHEEWIAMIGRKQRHEVRRKLRRFSAAVGNPRLFTATGSSAVADFAAMHRRSGGDKATFMTDEVESFFVELATTAGARIDVLCDDAGTPVASAYGFQDEHGYYLYNSAYEPAAAAVSPGSVLVTELIHRAIADGLTRFDFLKGDEVYKFRHGAQRRPLYLVEATIP